MQIKTIKVHKYQYKQQPFLVVVTVHLPRHKGI